MHKALGKLVAAASAAVLLGGLFGISIAVAEEGAQSAAEKGKEIAFDRKKGNCLACHQIAGGSLPGNIGPPLVAMSARYPDKKALRDQIFNATKRNPNTAMPPFGRHSILTDKEIDLVTEFIYTL